MMLCRLEWLMRFWVIHSLQWIFAASYSMEWILLLLYTFSDNSQEHTTNVSNDVTVRANPCFEPRLSSRHHNCWKPTVQASGPIRGDERLVVGQLRGYAAVSGVKPCGSKHNYRSLRFWFKFTSDPVSLDAVLKILARMRGRGVMINRPQQMQNRLI